MNVKLADPFEKWYVLSNASVILVKIRHKYPNTIATNMEIENKMGDEISIRAGRKERLAGYLFRSRVAISRDDGSVSWLLP